MNNSYNIYYTSNFTEIKCLDVLIEEVLGIITNGSFLEIGAYDGITNSKTYQLANIGWQGVYVEPIEEYATICKKNHSKNNVQVICAAITNKDQKQTIYKGKLASTFSEDNKKAIAALSSKKGGKFTFTTEVVKTFSWDSFIQKFSIKVPEILVIDAEGYDYKIIKQIDFNQFKPAIIFAEIFSAKSSFMSKKAFDEGELIKQKLLNSGYHIWIIEQHNTVFVDGKKLDSLELLPKKDRIANSVFNLYDNLKQDNNPNLTKEIVNRRGDVFLWSILETAIEQVNLTKVETLLTRISFLKSDFSETEIKLYIKGLSLLSKYKEIVLISYHWLSKNEKELFVVSNLAMALLKLKKYKEAATYYNWLVLKKPENKVWRNQLTLLKKL